MAAGSSPLLLQVAPWAHLKVPSGLSGEPTSKLASTRTDPDRGVYPGQDKSAGRIADVCKGFDGISSQPTGFHKQGLWHSLPGALLPGSRPRTRPSSGKPNGWVKGSIVLTLVLACSVQLATCVRHWGGGQHEWPDAAEVHSDSIGELHAEAVSLMRRQFAQMARQKVMEAQAEPSLSPLHNSTTKSFAMLQLDGLAATATGSPSAGLLRSLDNLGTVLVGEAEGGRALGLAIEGAEDMRGGHMNAEAAPYSFLNWGQIGGMMQNPALAHTGMPVYMPRQVIGTTIGLDFDSPATFHGPLLVLLMVCILIFFTVFFLCCWMVKSKQKHDKFMAEKLPR